MENEYLITYNFIENPLVLADFYVYQIGRIYCNKTTSYPNHYHTKWYELTIVTGGEGIIYTNNKPVPVKAGDIYLSCLHDIHAIVSSKSNPLQYDFCSFFPLDETLKDEFRLLSSTLHHENIRLFRSNKISNLFPLAINEIKDLDNNFAPILLNGIIWKFAVYTLRILKKEHSFDNTIIRDKDLLCYQMMDYITSNITTIHSLTELSEIFHFSYNYLSSIFKKVTSLKLIDFYNAQRLAIAEKLILENNLTLEEIAEKTNFSTAFSLSATFKKYYKVSPSQYRKQS